VVTLLKSALSRTITYCLNQWDKLIGFLDDGRLEIDNNRGERSTKPFVIGRKGWLFTNAPQGARASAMIYSIVGRRQYKPPACYLNCRSIKRLARWILSYAYQHSAEQIEVHFALGNQPGKSLAILATFLAVRFGVSNFILSGLFIGFVLLVDSFGMYLFGLLRPSKPENK
jgi:hypothetical protein